MFPLFPKKNATIQERIKSSLYILVTMPIMLAVLSIAFFIIWAAVGFVTLLSLLVYITLPVTVLFGLVYDDPEERVQRERERKLGESLVKLCNKVD